MCETFCCHSNNPADMTWQVPWQQAQEPHQLSSTYTHPPTCIAVDGRAWQVRVHAYNKTRWAQRERIGLCRAVMHQSQKQGQQRCAPCRTLNAPWLSVCSSTSGVMTSTSVSSSTALHLSRSQDDSRWLFMVPWYARVRKPCVRASASSHCCKNRQAGAFTNAHTLPMQSVWQPPPQCTGSGEQTPQQACCKVHQGCGLSLSVLQDAYPRRHPSAAACTAWDPSAASSFSPIGNVRTASGHVGWLRVLINTASSPGGK